MNPRTEEKKKGDPDAGSQEQVGDYLDAVGELALAGGFDPAPEVRAAFRSHPLFWLSRAVTGGVALGLVMGVVRMGLGLGSAGAAAFFVLAALALATLWTPLAMVAALEQLRGDGPPSLELQLEQFQEMVPEFRGLLGLLFPVPLFLIVLQGFLPPRALEFLLVPFSIFALLAWWPAVAEISLAGAGPRRALGSLFRREAPPATTRELLPQVLPGSVGQAQLLPTLARGFFLGFAGLAVVGLPLSLFTALVAAFLPGRGAYAVAMALVLGSYVSVVLDYTAAHYAGHYLVVLALRRQAGGEVRLRPPRESGEGGEPSP